jgi:hypothetical protein
MGSKKVILKNVPVNVKIPFSEIQWLVLMFTVMNLRV